MSPKGGIRPHKRFSVTSNRSEVLFVDYMAEHLTTNGRAAIVVPEGVIFQSGTAYKNLRKMLVDENYLVGVISLPAGVFNPYSGVKTSILWLDKALAKKTRNVLFAKIDADGFDLGAQRRPIKQNDLPHIFRQLTSYKTDIANGQTPDFDNEPNLSVVDKARIAEKDEYNLSGERYKVQVALNSQFELRPLGELCDIFGGGTPSKQEDKFWNDGKIPWISSRHIDERGQVVGNDWITEEGLKNSSSRIAPVNSTIFITRVSVGKFALADKNYAINQDLTAVVSKDESSLAGKYLFTISKAIANQIDKNAVGIGVRGVTKEFISSFKIPLPPLFIQEEIVAEIEGYQKIIDGARQVVTHYKPRITIDPDWEMVALSEICEVNPKKSELNGTSEDIEVSFVPMADLNENQMDFTPKTIKPLSEVIKGYTYFREDDVLLAKVTPCFENGKAGIAKGLTNKIGFGSSEYYVIRPNERILSVWIYINVTSDIFRENGTQKMTGTGGLQRVPREFVSSYIIPLPPLETQRQIVAQIEREQALVKANAELISIFEQKIKDRIAKVWGE